MKKKHFDADFMHLIVGVHINFVIETAFFGHGHLLVDVNLCIAH